MAEAKRCDLCKSFFLVEDELGSLLLREFDKDADEFKAIDLCPECESSLADWKLERRLKGMKGAATVG